MILQRAIKIKLDIPVESILPTFEAYTKAFNYVCDVGWNDQDFNPISLHNKTYYQLRTYLPSQLSISSRAKAAESLKAAIQKKRKNKKVNKPQSKLCSIRYDACSFNIWFDKNELSISTINGRIKSSFKVANCFKQYLTWKRCAAELFIQKKKIFLNIIFSKEVSDFQPNQNPIIIGIDRGINNLAVTSFNKFYSGKNVKRVTKRYEVLRSKLQSKSSQSAKRHLKMLSLKENRFKTNVNHKVSKEIIKTAPEGSIIVLENLKYIRSKIRSNNFGNRRLHKWSFGQLDTFLTYKAQAKFVLVDYVPAYFTSQKCSKCGHTDSKNRVNTSIFKCQKCGFTLNADLNAARNIELNYRKAKCLSEGLSINQPIITVST